MEVPGPVRDLQDPEGFFSFWSETESLPVKSTDPGSVRPIIIFNETYRPSAAHTQRGWPPHSSVVPVTISLGHVRAREWVEESVVGVPQ